MVVRITSPHSLKRVLNYNEQKVQKGQAECIHAGNFLLAAKQMNFHQKEERMQDLIALNQRSKKSNTLHISLNFDPSEKLTGEKLKQIAERYMEQIGFGIQPYLVYQHHDAAHPHIHIVTTLIKPDGKRIDTFNIGRTKSEAARKSIEEEFKLIRAQSTKKQPLGIKMSVEKVQYGKSETLRSISNVLDIVVNQFKYTSLAELNAALRFYNVTAERGKETSEMYKKGGLQYRLLKDGQLVGVPIKASALYSKPTLKNLEKRFEANKKQRELHRPRLRKTIHDVLANGVSSLDHFAFVLGKENIRCIIRRNEQGLEYGITFVDFRTKTVFNGSDVAKEYSVKGLASFLSSKQNQAKLVPNQAGSGTEKIKEPGFTLTPLLDAAGDYTNTPYQLRRKRKKKTRKTR